MSEEDLSLFIALVSSREGFDIPDEGCLEIAKLFLKKHPDITDDQLTGEIFDELFFDYSKYIVEH